ncbi:MAG: Hsp20/alpha crystallin family protein [Candidatus Coatesbacteria bacterium]|nr:Hsp20/alpha crystallin family protein [Candidatus Coatesbacteria bacterium]
MIQIEFDISAEIERIRERLNKLIEGVTGPVWDRSLDREHFSPTVDVFESSNALVILVELPGVTTSSLSVYGLGGAIFVEGIKEPHYPPADETNFHAFERRFGRFKVKVVIPCPIMFRKAKAWYEGGVLRIELPKIEERRHRKCDLPIEFL